MAQRFRQVAAVSATGPALTSRFATHCASTPGGDVPRSYYFHVAKLLREVRAALGFSASSGPAIWAARSDEQATDMSLGRSGQISSSGLVGSPFMLLASSMRRHVELHASKGAFPARRFCVDCVRG